MAFKLARRELRGGLKGFRVFIASLALGVAVIAGVGSLSQAVNSGLAADAAKLLGGDVDVQLLNRPASAAQKSYLAAAGRLSEVAELRAMARTESGSGRPVLIELKAVDGRYPLVGRMTLAPAMPLARALAERGGVWGAVAEKNLAAKLGLALGDVVRVGDGRFQLRALIAREPDRVASVISLGPRLMISAAALGQTGLIQPGSQVHFHYRIKLDGGNAPRRMIADLHKAFPEAGWRVRDVSGAAPGIRRFISRMTLFLTFVGLTTLLIGGIGVTNAVKSYLDGRVRTIATFKCLGAPAGLVFQTYLLQIAAIAAVGVVIGLGFGALAPWLGAKLLAGALPFALEAGPFPGALALAAAFGILTALTFALWPLARAREIPAAHLFRDVVASSPARPKKRFIAAAGLGGLALAALTVVFSENPGFAFWFVAGALAALGVLKAAAAGLGRAARRAGRASSGEWRLALANLHRPGASTGSVVVSLGLGLSVLIAIALIEGNLNRLISDRLPDTAPAFFFIDIQPGQTARFDRAVTAVGGTGDYRRVASLRGRIVKIDGVAVGQADIAPGSMWAVRGDRALTYAARPFADAKITRGKWWPADYAGPPLISLDANLARGFAVGIGDTLTLNILGREIEAEIANLREIDWRSLRFDFAIIFAPGALEGAPQTHIAAIEAEVDAEDAVEKAATEGFSNVSVIRVREALAAAADLLSSIGAGIRATAAITLAAGILVLSGAIAAGRHQRVYDAVVFKVLGATRRIVLKSFLIEFGILGAATGLIAAVIGSLTAWGVMVFLMKDEFLFLPVPVALTVLLALAITLVGGFAGTWRALGQKAAPLLRNE